MTAAARIADIAFRIDRNAKTPAFAQLYEAIRARIVSGALAEGVRLPPTRALALDLGLSRSTVNAAYEQLAAEGYVEGRQGAGHFVRPMGEVELPARARPEPRPAARTEAPGAPMPFQPGVPDMRLFPYAQWARRVSRIARTAPASLVTSSDAFGDLQLREAIASHIADWRGVETSAENILITAGSGDALELCIRALAAPGDRVALEDPGYPPLRAFVASLGLSPRWLEIDDAGAAVPEADDGPPPSLAVLTPSHQFPLGGAMTPARRNAFLAWAAEVGARIVEDDYDSEFRYSGRPIPALAGLDGVRRTIYVGSFSKIFSNSLRIGFLAMPDADRPAFRQALRQFGVKASIAPQRPLAAFMADGEFYRHLRRARRIYQERRKALVDGLRSQLGPAADFADHQAGMLLTLRLPEHVDDRAVVAAAGQKGLAPQALSAFYARPTTARGLVLGYCASTVEETAAALPPLVQILKTHGLDC